MNNYNKSYPKDFTKLFLNSRNTIYLSSHFTSIGAISGE